MYFRNYGLRNTWLTKSVKSPISEDPSGNNKVNWTVEIWTIAHLAYLLTTLKAIELEKAFHSDMKNLRSLC